MVATCQLSAEAKRSLAPVFGVPEGSVFGAELEFRELPYCIVSRAKIRWDATMGDVNELVLVRLADQGVVVDPELGSNATNPEAARLVLIPWQNIASLSITRKGSEQA
jgi:hypothetical protein